MSERALDTAARDLEQRLRQYPWFLSIGIGNTDEGAALFVYVKSRRHRPLTEIENGWRGHRVIIRAVGSIRPLSSARRKQAAA